MSHIHQYYLSVIAVLLLSGTATAKQTIKVGYIEFPPAFYTDKTGQANGILIKLTDKVMKKSGYSWTAHSYPTKRMAHYIATGELHLWVGLTTLPEFKGTTLIGPSKLLEISLQSYFIGKKPPINSKEDLKNKKIISVLGYSYGGLTNFIKDPNNKIINYETSSQESAFKMLKAGRAEPPPV